MELKKLTPVLYTNKEECCGCSACAAICPRDAIIMENDEEGFLYPKLIENICISCYKCINACPIKKKIINTRVIKVL